MRFMFKSIALSALLIGMFLNASQAFTLKIPQVNTKLPTAQKFVIKRGGNLTGFFQYGDFAPSRLDEINTMKAVGLDFIRLPIEPSRFYDANSLNWQRLNATIARANQLGLTVIVDLHPIFSTQDAALTGNGDPRYTALLTKMANYLSKYNQNKVALELMNEPIAAGDDKCPAEFNWNNWQRKFYTAARAGNKNITLILTGACWGGIDGLLKVEKIADPNVIYSFHDYDPFQFSHQSASWTGLEQIYLRQVPYPARPSAIARILPTILYGVPTEAQKTLYRDGLTGYGESGYNCASMLARMTEAKNWAIKNNVRLILGEFGVLQDHAPPQDRIVCLRDMREIAESLGIAHAVWDFSVDGNFGPYRNGKLEAGALAALGLKVPASAIATPANPPINAALKANPAVTKTLAIANFENGSNNLLGMPINYFNFGKPTLPSYSVADASGAAPISEGKIAFDFSIPPANEFGGVGVNIPTGNIINSQFSHVRFTLSATSGGQFRVGLSGNKIDTGGDYPQMTIFATAEPTQFTIAFSMFTQAGWGTKANLADLIANFNGIEITATEVGKPGRIYIDDVQLLNMR